MGCKSAPNALAEQVPGDVTLMTVLLISNEFTTNTGQLLENSQAKLGCMSPTAPAFGLKVLETRNSK